MLELRLLLSLQRLLDFLKRESLSGFQDALEILCVEWNPCSPLLKDSAPKKSEAFGIF